MPRPACYRSAGRDVVDLSSQREHLRIARAALVEYFRTGRGPDAELPAQDDAGGVFVSLHVITGDGERELRGCLGTLQLREPLARAVNRMAVAAATRDPRFPPVRPEELTDLEIEISVLTVPRPLDSPDDLVLGRHGLHVSRGEHRGLLLPQVATEHGWDREQFLAQACVKAGLPEDAWRDAGTRVEYFSADVFRDR